MVDCKTLVLAHGTAWLDTHYITFHACVVLVMRHYLFISLLPY